MTVPPEYWSASKDFEAFMADLKSVSLQATHNQCYQMARAVLHVFRRHLAVDQALLFANVLPPVLRAIFVEDWDAGAPTPFPDIATLRAEVKGVRQDHNVSTPTAINDVAVALRRHVDPVRFEAVLAKLPEAAAEFWRVTP